MLERPGDDIDALLIGALYGELTPADEARLNAHLDSHPADKSALAGLTSARNAVRESRFLTVQIEPPQAISALLLQEASRLAPARAVAKETPEAKESWFARFVASFARHPAMAAAAMLVIVVGFAGIMYSRKGDAQFAESTTSSHDHSVVAGAPPPAAEPTGAVEEAKLLQDKAGAAFEADLAEGKPTETPKPEPAAIAKDEKPERPRDDKKAAAPRPNTRTYIGVQTERAPQPKELENAPAMPLDFGGDGSLSARRGRDAVATGATAPGASDSRNEKREPVVATPAPPPPRAPQATVPRGAGGATGGEDQLQDRKADEESTWAREQHVKVTNAVKANNCKDATALAVALSNRAPGYYTTNVENDRALKQCMTYINAEREKEAERQRAQRALQKRNADEADRARRAAPPTTNSK